MPHDLEERGIAILMRRLHGVKRIRRGTFDIEVNGVLAEVKTKSKDFGNFDFIQLTDRQYRAAKKRPFDIYCVFGVNGTNPKILKINTADMLARRSRITRIHEFDKSRLTGLWKEVE